MVRGGCREVARGVARGGATNTTLKVVKVEKVENLEKVEKVEKEEKVAKVENVANVQKVETIGENLTDILVRLWIGERLQSLQ